MIDINVAENTTYSKLVLFPSIFQGLEYAPSILSSGFESCSVTAIPALDQNGCFHSLNIKQSKNKM